MKELDINGLHITMERRSIKNINLYVDPPDGQILVTVPRRCSEDEVLKFIRSREGWIRRAQESVRERARKTAAEEALTFTQEERLRLQKDIFFYAAKWEPVMGVHASKWQIREMKTRWGSCSVKTGNIRINLHLAQKPKECLEYVVVHELCHLLEPSHNARFHSLMDYFIPDWQARKSLLNEQKKD